MPVHNDLNKLRAAIARILGSAVSVPLELVCVDAGSLDGSADLLDELAATDDRIRVIRQPANSGPGSALREAIRHMRGDIAIIQDASVGTIRPTIPCSSALSSKGRPTPCSVLGLLRGPTAPCLATGLPPLIRVLPGSSTS